MESTLDRARDERPRKAVRRAWEAKEALHKALPFKLQNQFLCLFSQTLPTDLRNPYWGLYSGVLYY